MTDQPSVTKEEWIAALRSGEYAQTTGKLTDLDNTAVSCITKNLVEASSFCCIGVLGKLCVAKGDYFKEPEEVYNVARQLTKESYIELYKRNDGHGNFHKHTFNEIADYLESLP